MMLNYLGKKIVWCECGDQMAADSLRFEYLCYRCKRTKSAEALFREEMAHNGAFGQVPAVVVENIRHEPVDGMPTPQQAMPAPPDPADYRGETASQSYKADLALWAEKWRKHSAAARGQEVEVTIDLAPLTTGNRFRCSACRAEDLNDGDLALNPRDGQIYGCWHCGGKKLEKI